MRHVTAARRVKRRAPARRCVAGCKPVTRRGVGNSGNEACRLIAWQNYLVPNTTLTSLVILISSYCSTNYT